jgi:recombination protein RecR
VDATLAETVGVMGRLIQEFAKLPGIGPKSAERIAHFLLIDDRSIASGLINVLNDAMEQIHPCRQCFNLTEADLCAICSNMRRDPSVICVVETPRDLAVLERAGSFRGHYHVLNGRLAPLDGVGPDQLTLDALLRRVQKGGVNEVILATSPTTEGDGTALYASQMLASTGTAITRLARGIASGSSLELANAQMLADALEGRRAF